MKTLRAAALENPDVGPTLPEQHQHPKRLRIGYPQIIAGDYAKLGFAPLSQSVFQGREYQAETSGLYEGYSQIDFRGLIDSAE
jgi:hypothetical protein